MYHPRSIAIAALCTIGLLTTIDIACATPKQYQQGLKQGAAYGKKVGTDDGSGKSGTNAMHTNATCAIETPRNRDFDRGYTTGCAPAYKKAFERAYRQRKK
jgi:hypothetical protein